MVWTSIAGAASWTKSQIGTTLGNVKDSTARTYDLARTGNPNAFTGVTRRQTLESTAALLLGWEGAKMVPEAVDHAPRIQWKVGPFGDIDQENDVDRTATPGPEPTATEAPATVEENWVAEYDVDSFVQDLGEQERHSIVATNDFFGQAYDQERGIYEAGITDDNDFVVNDLGANLYNDEPGLGYSRDFGEKLKVLDNHDKLEDIVENYAEEELPESYRNLEPDYLEDQRV